MPDLNEIVETLAGQEKVDADGNPLPLIQGSFAVYATPEGGAVLAMNVKDGPLDGLHHAHATPKMLKAIAAFAGGGSKLNFLKALMTDGR